MCVGGMHTRNLNSTSVVALAAKKSPPQALLEQKIMERLEFVDSANTI